MLAGQVVLVFAIAALGVSLATQWTAAALGYQVRLGVPWFLLFGTPMYYPWRLFQWWYFYNAYAPGIFLRGGGIAACSGIASRRRCGRCIGLALQTIEVDHDLRVRALGFQR